MALALERKAQVRPVECNVTLAMVHEHVGGRERPRPPRAPEAPHKLERA